VCLCLSACATVSTLKDIHITWDEAVFRVPGVLPLSGWQQYISQLPPNTKFPTVIYLHGAGGLSSGAYGDIDVALKAGMAVIALNSYVRKRPYNVDGKNSSATYQILSIRKAEIVHALEQVRHVPWVDQNNLFAWGQSEGGMVLAIFPGAVFNGRNINRHRMSIRVQGQRTCVGNFIP